MYVRFFTDSRYPNNGFKAKVKIGVCGGTRFLGKTGSLELKSPDYPGHYRTNVDCVWSIQGPAGHYLSFTFVTLDLPNMQVVRTPSVSDCSLAKLSCQDCTGGDYVQVQEDNVTSPVLGTFCGPTRPPTLDSFGSNVRLVFHSDANQQDLTGFAVRVTASVEGKTVTQSLAFSQYLTRHHSSECGGDIEGTEGSIQSPGYPNTFAHRHSCTWRIRVPLGRKVTLTFEDFDLEGPVSYRNSSACRYDWLMVSTGQ